MLLRRFYYEIKPFLPWSIRLALRRVSARRQRQQNRATWPIDEAAAARPPSWSGWPEGRQFAFLLTHDVEGPAGLAKCQKLAELEMALGFRSSFNFIPEGPYAAPATLRKWLLDRGFEVGVHDLHHDGKLFGSEQGFQRKAARINGYLKDWSSAGFRSGFMLRNLEWIHELEILYDSSTFDTDPFELQPDGARTIFPFRITPPPAVLQRLEGARRAGYVELPYTLPQDSTLFLVLRENTPDIWMRKTDWISGHGGMALVNVHPDYLQFGPVGSSREYPAEIYSAFLRHVAAMHRNNYWNPTPRELAAWFNQVNPATPGPLTAVAAEPAGRHTVRLSQGQRRRRAAVLLYSSYPADPRPRRATETLAKAGMDVDMFCVAENADEPAREYIGGVAIHRIPLKHRRGSKFAYFFQYGRFLTAAFWFLARKGLRHRYDLIHVHNMPDVLVFSAIVPKLRGARIILDLHDPMPELMTTIFGTRERSAGMWMLKQLEKFSIRFSDTVITVNEACRQLFSSRNKCADKINVVMNSPDETIFQFSPAADAPTPAQPGRPFVVMYHGSLVERHGLDLAVAAMAKLRVSIPAQLWIFGSDTKYLRKVMEGVQNSGMQDCVHYFGPKTLEQIVQAIRRCDVGIIPNRRSIFTEINTPTRIFEYLSQGRPVVAPRARGILDYFGPEDLLYFELGDADGLAEKLEYAYRNPQATCEIVKRGQRVYRSHDWQSEQRRFLTIVATVLGAGAAAPASADVPAISATN